MSTDAPAADDGWKKFTPVQRAMARRMERTVDVPIATEFTHVDIAAALAEIARLRDAGTRVTFTGLVLAAAAQGLREFPQVAAEVDYESWKIRLPESIDVGVAVASQRGLVVPVVRGVNGKPPLALATELQEITGLVREGAAEPSLFAGGHLSITSMGSMPIYGGFPLPSTPQIAILGVSGSWDAPVVVDGEIKVSKLVRLTIALDHRALDGMTAGLFLVRLKELIEDPVNLLAGTVPASDGAE